MIAKYLKHPVSPDLDTSIDELIIEHPMEFSATEPRLLLSLPPDEGDDETFVYSPPGSPPSSACSNSGVSSPPCGTDAPDSLLVDLGPFPAPCGHLPNVLFFKGVHIRARPLAQDLEKRFRQRLIHVRICKRSFQSPHSIFQSFDLTRLVWFCHSYNLSQKVRFAVLVHPPFHRSLINTIRL